MKVKQKIFRLDISEVEIISSFHKVKEDKWTPARVMKQLRNVKELHLFIRVHSCPDVVQ